MCVLKPATVNKFNTPSVDLFPKHYLGVYSVQAIA